MTQHKTKLAAAALLALPLAGCITVKAQAWTGSHFETFRTWALPRLS